MLQKANMFNQDLDAVVSLQDSLKISLLAGDKRVHLMSRKIPKYGSVAHLGRCHHDFESSSAAVGFVTIAFVEREGGRESLWIARG